MKNNIGVQFGKWTVLEFSHSDKKSNKFYLCKCDCGTIKSHRIDILKSGESTQCKSCYMLQLNKVEDLIGQLFGSWKVLEKIKNVERNEWFYKCICKCGTIRNIPAHHLKSKSTTQCNKCRNKTHGMSNTPTFRIWTGILRRCLNNKFKAYKYYGGRGIKVCDRWLIFENFLADMGERPAMLQIDRINNDGNYEPTNCRWVSSKENNQNRNILRKIKGN